MTLSTSAKPGTRRSGPPRDGGKHGEIVDHSNHIGAKYAMIASRRIVLQQYSPGQSLARKFRRHSLSDDVRGLGRRHSGIGLSLRRRRGARHRIDERCSSRACLARAGARAPAYAAAASVASQPAAPPGRTPEAPEDCTASGSLRSIPARTEQRMFRDIECVAERSHRTWGCACMTRRGRSLTGSQGRGRIRAAIMVERYKRTRCTA